MATSSPELNLVLTSYCGDFNKERDLVLSQVLPNIQDWCESQNIHLKVNDFRWGGYLSPHRISSLLQELSVSQSHHCFLNITSESLGVVPKPEQQHSSDVIQAYTAAFSLSTEEYSILQQAYAAENAVYLLRDDSFLDYLLEEEESFFVRRSLLPEPLRTLAPKYIAALPEGSVCPFHYDAAGWDYDTNRLEIKLDAATLTRKLRDKVKHSISECLATAMDDSSSSSGSSSAAGSAMLLPYTDMLCTQTAFVEAYSHHVRGRDDVVQQVVEYVDSGGNDVPVVLLGGEGSGKTSTITKLTHTLQKGLDQKQLTRSDGRGWRLFYHFAGATPCSSDLMPMLKRLLLAMETVPESGLPKDLDACAHLCCMALSNPSTEPIIVIVDAVDQFSIDHQAALILSWVPRKLAPHVRCVLSTVQDTPQHKVLDSRESKPQEIRLEPLSYAHNKEIVEDFLASSHRSLSVDRINALLIKPSAQNPLWLTISCEELSRLKSTKELDQRICSLPRGLLCLLEEVLMRLEQGKLGELLSATLCLLEASVSGLSEFELLHLLSDDSQLTPPSPFAEKEEKESSEKENRRREKEQPRMLPQHKWSDVYETLQPFIRPFGASRQGRLHFYHRALSKAVRKRYFHEGVENQDVESPEIQRFWHQKLADYFHQCEDVDRQAEEYVYQLSALDDNTRLAESLCHWPLFERLYHEEFSTKLLGYWRQVQLGKPQQMIDSYKSALTALEGEEPRDEKELSMRYEQVARVFLQAGVYLDALELCEVSVKWEEVELGNRPHRMVELYSLMAEIYDEKLKLNDFVSPEQLPDLRKTISFGRKSIELREKLSGSYHKFKLGMSLMKLAFSLESWDACQGDLELSGAAALAEGNKHIDKAVTMFKELKDMGHYAEALMTKGVLAPRGSSEQLKYYNEAQEICRQVYGETSLLASRLYINIGIVHEDNQDYVKAFDFFKKWARVSESVLGPEHPKTLRAKGVLKEPRYQLVAQRLKDMEDGGGREGQLTEESINQEAGVVADQQASGADHRENREIDEAGGGDGVGNFLHVTEELQQAINDLLHRALGEVDIRQEVLQNILNTMQSNRTPGNSNGRGGREELDEDDDDDDDDDDDTDEEGALL